MGAIVEILKAVLDKGRAYALFFLAGLSLLILVAISNKDINLPSLPLKIIYAITGIVFMIVGVLFFMKGDKTSYVIPGLRVRTIFQIPGENPDRDKRMKEVFWGHTESMRLMARTGFHYLHSEGHNWLCFPDRKMGVKTNLQKGIPMEVILEDPFSENAGCRQRADSKLPSKPTPPFFDISWSMLEQRVKEYPNLKIYFTTAPMTCSLFFIGNSVFYDPYHFGKLRDADRTKNHFFVMEFEKPHDAKDACCGYELLRCHFEFVKQDKSTMTFDAFRKKYAAYLKGSVTLDL